MRILICKSGLFGGADFLLERLRAYLLEREIDADILCAPENDFSMRYARYDLAVLPSYRMHDIVALKRRGVQIERVLLWIMGSGSFQETYYNPSRDHGVFKLVYAPLKREAARALRSLYDSGSLCFTDEVGMYATLAPLGRDCEREKDGNIIPIIVPIPETYPIKEKPAGAVRIAWIGRISNDFKLIPLLHLIRDAALYRAGGGIDISLTIVGNGDALDRLRASAAQENISVRFIGNIAYESIGEFLRENADFLVAMGTSALDGARNGCPTAIITPVRDSDPEEVHYRWVFESKGYSLGEYPGLDADQVKKPFDRMIEEYLRRDDLQILSYEYAAMFGGDAVTDKLLGRALPNPIDARVWKHLRRFERIAKLKAHLKKRMEGKRHDHAQ